MREFWHINAEMFVEGVLAEAELWLASLMLSSCWIVRCKVRMSNRVLLSRLLQHWSVQDSQAAHVMRFSTKRIKTAVLGVDS